MPLNHYCKRNNGTTALKNICACVYIIVLLSYLKLGKQKNKKTKDIHSTIVQPLNTVVFVRTWTAHSVAPGH